MQKDVTLMLRAITAGDERASARLLPIVYDELRSLASARLAREHARRSLDATGLVHEAYLRLVGPPMMDRDGSGPEATDPEWEGRAHFFAAAAEAMRRVLIDRARARGAAKRGGRGDASGRARRLRLESLSLEDEAAISGEMLELDEALTLLAAEAPEKARLVELRFFGGLTQAQAAAVLGVSTSTADRWWSYARAWLYHELGESG